MNVLNLASSVKLAENNRKYIRYRILYRNIAAPDRAHVPSPSRYWHVLFVLGARQALHIIAHYVTKHVMCIWRSRRRSLNCSTERIICTLVMSAATMHLLHNVYGTTEIAKDVGLDLISVAKHLQNYLQKNHLLNASLINSRSHITEQVKNRLWKATHIYSTTTSSLAHPKKTSLSEQLVSSSHISINEQVHHYKSLLQNAAKCSPPHLNICIRREYRIDARDYTTKASPFKQKYAF